MKRVKKPKRHQPYQYTLDDLQAMVEQLGGRLHMQIYPKELDDPQPVPPAAAEARAPEEGNK